MKLRHSLATLVFASSVLFGACSRAPQDAPIWRYRDDGAGSIEILTSTAEGWETWIASLEESATTVRVKVLTRQTGSGAGAFGAKDIWLPAVLGAPLGGRSVVEWQTGRVVPRAN